MIGSLFAGTDESPGEISLYQGRSFKNYYRETIETVNLDWLNKSIRFKKNSYVFLKVDVEGLEEIVIREFLNTNFVIHLLFLILWSILPPCMIGIYFREHNFEISAK